MRCLGAHRPHPRTELRDGDVKEWKGEGPLWPQREAMRAIPTCGAPAPPATGHRTSCRRRARGQEGVVWRGRQAQAAASRRGPNTPSHKYRWFFRLLPTTLSFGRPSPCILPCPLNTLRDPSFPSFLPAISSPASCFFSLLPFPLSQSISLSLPFRHLHLSSHFSIIVTKTSFTTHYRCRHFLATRLSAPLSFTHALR